MGKKNAIPGTPTSPGSPLTGKLIPGLTLMNAVPVSSTNIYTSVPFNATNLDNIGLDIIFTGTMTGNLYVTCSIDGIDYQPLTFNPVLPQPSGTNLEYLVSLNQLPFPYLEIYYINVSGTGTLTVKLSAKDLN